MQWLDLYRYFRKLRSDDDIQHINYFTAPLTGSANVAQQAYLDALAAQPLINLVPGKYQVQLTDCGVEQCMHQGPRRFFQYKEKRTDVNIALRMANDTFQNECDRLVLVTGDSDLVPAVQLVRQLGKKVNLYVPTIDEDRYVASELRGVADMSKNLPLANLVDYQFPEKIPDGKGGFIAKNPAW
jgi:uncharacterized LabA/DUF88 family protein